MTAVTAQRAQYQLPAGGLDVMALAALTGERDPAVVAAFVAGAGVDSLVRLAFEELAADPGRVIASLADHELIGAAEALAPLVTDPASRELATVMAAVRGQFAAEELRAAQARHALALIADWMKGQRKEARNP